MIIPPPPIYALDIECYRDYFLVMVKHVVTGDVAYREACDGQYLSPLAMELVYNRCIITFNGRNYDIPMLSYALTGATCAQLKALSDDIILHNLKPWDAGDKYGFSGMLRDDLDHIDLIEVAPGQASLKIYGGRLHSKRMQDLPIPPDASISPEQRQQLRTYCANDLDTTIDLLNKLEPQLALRQQMSAEYGIDLRSKSDAQMAEAVIRQEVQRIVGHKVYRPELARDYSFKYRVPNWVNFQAPGLTRVVDIIRNATFTLSLDGSVELPAELSSMRLRIGQGVYRMGIGGLHSSETCIAHRADAQTRIVDRDVASYYPQIILNEGLYPTHLGSAFLEVYRGLVDGRLEAKRTGNKVKADSYKILVNGSFGKLGSPWSVLYSPDLLIAVTLTGQLALLMLIEMLEAAGFAVLSANTDGVVTRVPTARTAEFEMWCNLWASVTGFATEETEYAALYSRDVNNYIAIKPDGTTKLKGAYAFEGMQKNPSNVVCIEAVIDMLQFLQVWGDVLPNSGLKYLSECIDRRTDPRKFLTIRKVNGGAMYDGTYLGKAVRWYYAKGETRHITYVSNGNKVARSDGARPLMELPDVMPPDVDYEWYVREAQSILGDIGA